MCYHSIKQAAPLCGARGHARSALVLFYMHYSIIPSVGAVSMMSFLDRCTRHLVESPLEQWTPGLTCFDAWTWVSKSRIVGYGGFS